jgi:exodeoxyribonuclease VII large subunit
VSEPRLFEVESTVTVGELSNQIGRALKRGFPDEIWVKGQIRNLSGSRAGHRYFDLVDPVESGRDPEASIPVVLFDSNRQIVNRILGRAGAPRMEDGVEIRLRGELDFYARQGRTQIRMTGVDAEYTLGKLAADRERLVAELTKAGLLQRNSSLALAPVPMRIGLVTSDGSAACADFLAQLQASGLAFHVSLVDAQVQGLGADVAIAAGIRRAARHAVDAVALVRGGGSRTDLGPFDTRMVALAIADSEVPILTGIGHETDQAVADLVAHTSVKTPTACAQLLIDQVDDFRTRIETAWQQVSAASTAELGGARRRIARSGEAALVLTRHAVNNAGKFSAETARRVTREARRHGPAATRQLAEIEAKVRLLDPQHTLARGWSITRAADGRVLRSAAQVAPGETVATRLGDGIFKSVVSAVEKGPNS